MVSEQESMKWEGEIIEEMNHVAPQQLWSLIADFCSINKLFPQVDKCYLVEGVQVEPNLVRCCEFSIFPGAEAQFANEKLVMIDLSKMCLTYEITENNVGFRSYVATMQLFPIENEGEKCGCKFVWTIVADPVEGYTQEALFELLKSMSQAMAKKMEVAFSQT